MERVGKKTTRPERGVTRRGFLGTVGVGAVGAVVAPAVAGSCPTTAPVEQAVSCTLRVNGQRCTVLVEPATTLLAVLRDQLALTGTKPGCERGECGACTVLVDDLPRYACLTLALEVEGKEITTIEGLVRDGKLSAVQEAFVEEDAFQCGFCTPGQVMAAEGLLRRNPHPDREAIRVGMSGNLCRCGAYDHILKAVERAARRRG